MRLAILAMLLTAPFAAAGPVQVEFLGGNSTSTIPAGLGEFGYTPTDNGVKISFTPSHSGPANYDDPNWNGTDSNDVSFRIPFDVSLRITAPSGIYGDFDVQGYVDVSWIHKWDGLYLDPLALFGGNPMTVTIDSNTYGIQVLDNTEVFFATASGTVQVSAPTPEPCTLALALIGLVPLIRRRILSP
jgi:hypothetical protein